MTNTDNIQRVERRGCTAVGVTLISAGALVLATRWMGLDLGHLGWPFLVILPGMALLILAATGNRMFASMSVPASMITTTGLILLVQNTFNLWDTWAYAWSLLIVGSGVGLVLQGIGTDNPRLRSSGWSTIKGGAITFVLFAGYFELVLNLNNFANTNLGQFGAPLALIGIGAMLLVRPWRTAAE